MRPIDDNRTDETQDEEPEDALVSEASEALEREGQTREEERQFLLDQLQRSRAELENFRRRTAEQRRVQERRLTGDIVRRVLPLFDDLRLAHASAPSGGELSEGVRIILDEFRQILESFGVVAIEAVGQPFDPEWHEALFQEETTAVPDGEVLGELERGYRIGDELIRPARVKVAKAPAAEG